MCNKYYIYVISTILYSSFFFFPSFASVGSGSGSSSGAASVLVPGDVVEVMEGDLMNLQGKVQSVDGNTITIMPRHEDLKVRDGLRGVAESTIEITWMFMMYNNIVLVLYRGELALGSPLPFLPFPLEFWE